MDYDKEIMRIMAEAAPRGLTVSKIALHVYNACNTLFSPVTHEEVHRYVSQYLSRNSKRPESPVTKTERGVYVLDIKSVVTQQLLLDFRDEPVATEQPRAAEDLSLNLF